MRFIDYIKTAFGNLRRRKMRTFLTSFAVSIGTMLIILMVSLGVGVRDLIINTIKESTSATLISVSPNKVDTSSKEEVEKKAKNDDDDDAPAMDGVFSLSKTKFTKISDENVDKITKMNEVSDISLKSSVKINTISLGDKTRKNPTLTGIDTRYSILTKGEIESIQLKEKDSSLKLIKEGRAFNKEDKNSAIIGAEYLKKLGVENPKDAIGKELKLGATAQPVSPNNNSEIPMNSVKVVTNNNTPKANPLNKTVTIVGVIDEKFPLKDKIIVSLDVAADFLNYLNANDKYFEEKGVEALNVDVKNITDVTDVSKSIEDMGYATSNIQSFISGIKTTFSVIQGVLSVVGVIIIFVASLGVINTMTMAIYERTRSIGIMKALGASKTDIKLLFLTESGAIGFLGGLLGLLFSTINVGIIKVVLKIYLNSKGITDVPQVFSTPIWLIAGTIGFAVLISILAGILPASKAAKLDPVESLRYE
ncbi:ABC transporter permease [Clostridium hydrogeniformans]|uniref:ABC transporter permease n=1 Tax=Clostridium hydrogeniformans TaxID=349933 RepID=UPI0004829083|nr:ABC transporter permease [Clostridium hydrogeniformans]